LTTYLWIPSFSPLFPPSHNQSFDISHPFILGVWANITGRENDGRRAWRQITQMREVVEWRHRQILQMGKTAREKGRKMKKEKSKKGKGKRGKKEEEKKEKRKEEGREGRRQRRKKERKKKTGKREWKKETGQEEGNRERKNEKDKTGKKRQDRENGTERTTGTARDNERRRKVARDKLDRQAIQYLPSLIVCQRSSELIRIWQCSPKPGRI
jgi:hypothetical protein